MVERQHGVRLAATECGLELDDWISTPPCQAAYDGVEQKPHPFGDESTLKEVDRLLILWACLTGVDLG
ncbi:hypothetical protein D3C87_2047560 [compost metagenome]